MVPVLAVRDEPAPSTMLAVVLVPEVMLVNVRVLAVERAAPFHVSVPPTL